MPDDAVARLYQALVGQDAAAAIAIVESARRSGVAHGQLFDQVFTPALSMLGAAWANGTVDEYEFTNAAVVAEQITSFVAPPLTAPDTGITVLVGTMHHDLHTIEKDIAAAALKEAGYRVIDLGASVRPAIFLERAEQTAARVLIVYAQLVATARSARRVRDMFRAAGRDAAILVSGAPFVAEKGLARAVGANGVVHGAESALRLVAEAGERLERQKP